MARTTVLGAVLSCAVGALALDNGLGRVPQMGYNSWYDWMCNMNETQLMWSVDAMVSNGLVDLGYVYFNLDDCWSKGRYPNGSQYADFKYFPSGTLKPLADYAHSKGMKFGTYTDRGSSTCAGRPGALDHEVIDANTYASWGVDYLKEDSCHASQDHDTAFGEYGNMTKALNGTGRPIFFSLCGWNSWYAPMGKKLGNSWRIGPDDTNWGGVLANIDINAALSEYAGPDGSGGGWNDPCLLLAEEWTGQQRMTELQTRAQFNMWAVMASPLLISANVINMSAMNMATYKNKKVIAVNQDPLGKQGTRVVGGPLLDTMADGRHPAGNTPATLVSCNVKDATQKWVLNTPAAGYVKNPSSNLCLNVDDCGSDIIYFECVESGLTCCGQGCMNVMKFNITADGKLTSPQHPGQCALAIGDAVSFGDCSGAATQKWAYDETTGAISNTAGASTRCLSTNVVPPTKTEVNVWARPLSTGALVAMDLWDDNSGPIKITGANYTVNLPAAGGSAHYTITKSA